MKAKVKETILKDDIEIDEIASEYQRSTLAFIMGWFTGNVRKIQVNILSNKQVRHPYAGKKKNLDPSLAYGDMQKLAQSRSYSAYNNYSYDILKIWVHFQDHASG